MLTVECVSTKSISRIPRNSLVRAKAGVTQQLIEAGKLQSERLQFLGQIDHPAHYGGADNPYEAIKVIEAWELGFNLGNVVKYVSRAGKKDAELQELKKAAWYLNREIENMEAKEKLKTWKLKKMNNSALDYSTVTSNMPARMPQLNDALNDKNFSLAERLVNGLITDLTFVQNWINSNREPEMIKFEDMVKALAKPGEAIISQLTPDTAHNIHMAIGIAGEAGELLDAIKKQAIYNKPVDRENVVEELGDLEFYMEGLRQRLGITREETLVANIAKLGKRYEGLKYSDQAAQVRADKQG